MKRFSFRVMVMSAVQAFALAGSTYYVDPTAGNDQNDGRSPQTAWSSLEKAGSIKYAKGDRLLLKRGTVFNGALALQATGTRSSPVTVDAYGEGEMPVIDSRGQVAGLFISGCDYLEINNVSITADGGAIVEEDGGPRRYGVLIRTDVDASRHIYLRGLYIHDIFGPKTDVNGTGTGIQVEAPGTGTIQDLLIEDCRIERTAAVGIMIRGGRGSGYRVSDIRILNNRLKDIGGPGMNPMGVTRLVVRGNVVDSSGSSADPRMRGRGSGIWPWGSDDVLIEKNTFMHARGINDSCGVHIDFNCRNVIVQYNLSVDNAGGFVEILGNNYNCAYRYNISVNDGFRIRGTNGAQTYGKTIWLSSFTGNTGVKRGPFNSYIYNNTIYVKPEIRSMFEITRTAEGALIANNIFHILGDTGVSFDLQERKVPESVTVKEIVIKNNLYLRADTLPGNLPVQNGEPLHDMAELVGDPQFKRPGGLDAADYVPANAELVKDKAVRITALPGDTVGLKPGFDVTKDILGNPIVGMPDLGAIEVK